VNEPVKLLMTWNIKPGQEQAYFTFVMQELLVVVRRAGLKLTDVWYTVYGDWPQVRMAFVGESVSEVQAFLSSPQWLEVKQRLLAYTQDYQRKIVRARGGLQL